MKVVAVVPMKLNNERLPNKNTKAFKNGEPLCTYILNTLLEVKEIEEVYVYCSNPVIKKYLPFGVKYLKRSESLDQASTSMNEVLKAFSDDIDSEFYLMTHTTAPFIQAKSIRDSLRKVLSSEYDSAFTVKLIQEFLWEDGRPMNYELSNIPRTQDLKKIYAETSGYYIYKKEMIQKYNRRIGDRPFLQVISEIEAIDIDEKDDFLIAESIYNSIYAGRGNDE